MEATNQNWVSKARQEIAECEIKIEQHLRAHQEYLNMAWGIGPNENYAEFEKYENLALEERHQYGLLQYKLKALKYDLHYDLGYFDNDNIEVDSRDDYETEDSDE